MWQTKLWWLQFRRQILFHLMSRVKGTQAGVKCMQKSLHLHDSAKVEEKHEIKAKLIHQEGQ